MPRLLAALLLALASQSCASSRHAEASTPEQQAVMASITQFVGAFNAGDAAKAIAACTDEMAIVDEFAPHAWHGSGALAQWLGDYDVDAKKRGISDGVVTLGAPLHLDVAGEHAYAVIPSDYEFKMQGKPVKESEALFTFALKKGAAGWRICGWSWAKN